MSDIKSKKHVKSSWASHSSKVDKSWGVEHRWGCFGSIGAKLLIMEKGGKTSFKMHPLKNEVFYILSGKILATYGSEISLQDPVISPMQQRTFTTGEILCVQSCCPYQLEALEDSQIIETGDDNRDTVVYLDEESIKINE